MGGGHGVERVQTEAIELRHLGFQAGVVDLVHHQQNGLADAPQIVHDFGVAFLGALTAVHHQKDGVGLLDRGLGLAPHPAGEVFFPAHQATGIYQQDGVVIESQGAVMTIPGDPGNIGYQGLGGAGEAIEEGGLPHVGPADDGHQRLLDRKHSHFLGVAAGAGLC